MVSKHEQEHCFPLSLSQQNILNLERSFPGTSINNISTTVRIKGQLDFPLLQESIHCVLEKDVSLSTRLKEVNSGVLQYHVPYIRENFPVYDFGNTSEEGFSSWEAAVTRERIPLFEGLLYRFILFRDGEGSGGFLVKIHHIIADGWSQVMICNRIGQTYLELLAGKIPSLEEAPDYELHVQEEQDYLKSKAFSRDGRYWKQILEQSGEPSVLKAVNSAVVSPVGNRLSFELPQVLNHAIYSFCQEKRVAPFAVMYMALAIYFKRIGGADRFTVGVPIFNRTNHQFKQSTGMFVTTLPFYNEIKDEWTLNEFNDDLMDAWYEMLRHQRYPFTEITKMAGRDGRLFHIALSYQDSKIFQSKDASVLLSGRWHYCGYQAEQLTIHLTNLLDNKKYAIDYDYLAQFFTEEEIQNLHNSLCEILYEALAEPDKPIHRLHVLSLTEKEKLLYTFNETDRYLPEQTVYEALIVSSNRYLNRVAAICDGERMTYGALLHRSAQIAVTLAKQNVKQNDLVAIYLPRKLDLLASMTGSLQAECGYVILSEELPIERVRNILRQSQASVLITSEKGRRRLGMCDVPVLCVEEIGTSGEVLYIKECIEEKKPLKSAERLAYVVYTSGSTGEPKGVEITQRNLLNLAQEMKNVYGRGAVLSVCNVGFDAFMLESIVALLNGRTIVLPADADLESPEKLASLINGHAVGYFSMTPSRLSAFLQSNAFCKVMWRMESIVCGGEAFPAELLKRLKKISNARIYNQYGPSETTVTVSMKELSHADKITAGRPMGNCRLYVLDKWMNPLPVGGLGNLYIGGECVGLGYRNQPELTAQSFRSNPFVSEDRIYNTGDIACWTTDGEIVLAGRMDNQIKLRGLRIEPQEVAACIESYPGILAATARVCDVNGQKVLGAYYCAEGDINETELMAHTATYLPRYMIPAFLIRMHEFPVNANGKIDEKRLPLPDENGTEYPEHMTSTAEVILKVFGEVLGLTDLHGNSDYFLCGGNSLNAMECIMRLEEELGRKLRIADLYACKTAIRLAAYLEGNVVQAAVVSGTKRNVVRTLEKAPVCSQYVLSPMQQGMYVQSVLDPDGISYNMPGAFLLSEKPDVDKLKQALKILVHEDAIFRTQYVQEKDGLCAEIIKEITVDLEALEGNDFRSVCEQFVRPFDLAKAPLLRAGLWKSQEEQWYLFLDSHHIIGDGMSTPLILKRLDEAYRKGFLRVERNYYDYLYALSMEKESTAKKQELAFWVEHLQNMPEPLVLPGDFARPKKFDFKGADLELMLSEAESEVCRNFCKEKGMSEFTLFLAAYGVLLSAISGREDFMIGAPVAGRTMPGTGEICGPFINTLPLRLKPERTLSVQEWFALVQDEIAGMLDHQHTTAEEIIQALNLPRGEQNALYQVMLTQSPVDEDAFSLNGQKMKYKPISTGAAKMDMVLEVAQKEKKYALRFSYARSIFLEETINFYARCMKQILLELVKDSDKKLEKLNVLSPQDYIKYVEMPNYQVTPFVNVPIHKIIRNKVVALGDQTAVIFEGNKISYNQIERRAAGIAQFLEQNGVQPGQSVGLCLSRTPDMIAAMYGVLKAGCAYVFMLPKFPTERIKYMLESAKAGIMFYDELAKIALPEDFWNVDMPCQVCCLPEGEAEFYMDRPLVGEQLTNIHFTSGSTGRPKGVMFRHRGVSNMYSQVKALLDPIEGSVLCSTNSVFDCFMVETLVMLALGRTVVLANEEEMMLPWKLAQLIEDYQVGVFEMTPTRMQMCLRNEAFCKAARHIRIAMIGGEAMPKTLQKKFYEHSDGILLNMYGPSESTVYTTMVHIKPNDHITVGRPMQNIRTYVLDEKMRPVIPTAYGELYIAGECLAAGYSSSPELTEKAFVEDIYFPGEKMYKSGDMVRLRLDGTYDFFGRKDTQVKLNGQRVELDEITGAILASGLANQAATIPVHNEDGSMGLCAFYEPARPGKLKEKIVEHLRRVLPVYMIPSRIKAVAQMPMNASNKIDLQALLKMAADNKEETIEKSFTESVAESKIEITEENVQIVDTDKKEPVKATVSYVLSVWKRVLGNHDFDADVSFFTQGGTSMAALNVLSYYYNDHLEMSLSEFYENATANQQAQLLEKRQNISESVVEHTVEEVSEKMQNPPSITEQVGNYRNMLENLLSGNHQKNKKKDILVTGATGFFGVHLVKALLSEGERKIICLMRDGDSHRLYECLGWYFGQGMLVKMKKGLEVVSGDISKEKLGMKEDAYQELASRVGEIYHCAADVRHYVAEEESYLNTNVGGTKHMLEFAKIAKASFYHMSTCSVSGETLKENQAQKVFTEHDYDIGQVWEDNIYVKSKFLAEGLVYQAAEEGLRAKIFRLGRLVGRLSDGVFQKNPDTNAFYLLMKAFCQAGVVPQAAANISVDLMPIDVCADEVLALKDSADMVYHIMSHMPPTLKDAVMALDGQVKVVKDDEFIRALLERSQSMDKELSALLMNYLYGVKSGSQNISVSNNLTLEKLVEQGYQLQNLNTKQILQGFSV